MYEFYKLKPGEDVLKKSRKELKRLYSQVPETEGCKENIAKEDGCGAWCCEHQTPQVMYVEFLNTWHFVLQNYPAEKVASLLLKAVRLYLSDNPTKGCIFWDKKTKLCSQHQTRPLNCRAYGQIPDEEFKPRFERLKVLYEKQPLAYVKEQCNLVKTVGDKKPTKEDTDAWQVYLEQIEASIGIDKKLISDAPGGSYRAYHDHILLRLGSVPFLTELTSVKTSGTKEEKEAYVKALHKKLRTQHPYLEETVDEDAASAIIIPETQAIIKPKTAPGNNSVGIILPG